MLGEVFGAKQRCPGSYCNNPCIPRARASSERLGVRPKASVSCTPNMFGTARMLVLGLALPSRELALKGASSAHPPCGGPPPSARICRPNMVAHRVTEGALAGDSDFLAGDFLAGMQRAPSAADVAHVEAHGPRLPPAQLPVAPRLLSSPRGVCSRSRPASTRAR